jgi:hypothetical protein
MAAQKSAIPQPPPDTGGFFILFTNPTEGSAMKVNRKVLTVLAMGLAFPAGAAIADGASQTGGQPSGGQPGHPPPPCKTGDQWCPPHTTSTESETKTETQPGQTTTKTVTSTVTATQTVTGPSETVTVTTPAVPPSVPAPVITITQGSVNNTVNITITINGVPQTITVPGNLPGTKPGCVNTLKSSTLGPLPRRFKGVKQVTVHIDGRNELRSLSPSRKASVNVAGLACGTYAIVANDFPNTKAVTPVLRIWALTGGNHVQKAGFPLPDPPIGLS